MIPEIPPLLLILKEACEKFGLSWRLSDTYSNNLVEISNWKKIFVSSNSTVWTYPLNQNFSAQLINDKARCYKILKQKWYKIPEWDYFFLNKEYRESRWDWKEINNAITFAKNKYPVFVKPNNSSLWILAEIINNETELKTHLKNISEISWIAIVQEIINLPEYRIFAIDWEIEFVYRRLIAKIIWDWKTTIAEFIEKININIKRERNIISENSIFLKKQLKKHNLSFNSILDLGQELQITPKANISSGGEIQDYSEIVSKETCEWVKKLMQDLSLRICGIDVFVKKSIDNPDGFIIIEINGSPSLSWIYKLGHQNKALGIWEKILKKFFEE